MDADFYELVGRQVLGLQKRDDNAILVFDCLGASFAYMAEGDCCSHSWFEAINGLDQLLGNVVTRVIAREMPDATESEYEVTQYYGWTLETDKGRFDIEMRNESNGYYGGYVQRYHGKTSDCSAVKEDFPLPTGATQK